MKILIDVDNTIVDYRKAIINCIEKILPGFSKVNNLNSNQSVIDIKKSIKETLDDSFWQLIQAEIYSHNNEIYFYPGVEDAMRKIANYGFDLYILSHRTKYGLGTSSNINIREISTKRIFEWIHKSELTNIISGVMFFDTKDIKIQAMQLLKPYAIVDDLDNVHLEYLKVQDDHHISSNILFNGTDLIHPRQANIDPRLIELNSWNQIQEHLILNRP